MKLPKCLVLVTFFALILFSFLRLEHEITGGSEGKENSLGLAIQTAKEMHFKANLDFQLQSWFSKFRVILTQGNHSIANIANEPEFLKINLPPHTLTIARADEEGNLHDFKSLSGSMDAEMVRLFVAVAREFKTQLNDYSITDEKRMLLEKCDLKLREFLDVPTARLNMIILRASRFSVFTSLDKTIYFYWDRFLDKNGHQIYFFSKIDLTNISPEFVYRSFLKTTEENDLYCAYYDMNNRRFISTEKFKRFVKLPDLKTIARECRQLDGKGIQTISFDRKKVLIGRKIGATDFYPVVAISDKENKANSILIGNIPVFALACLLILFFVNTSVFDRGIDFKVGTVLIVAIVSAIMMPFMFGRSIFKLIMRESYEKQHLKIERDLHQALTGIDYSYKTSQQNLCERTRNIFNDPGIVEGIHLDEVQSDQKGVDASVILTVVDRIFEKAAKDFDFIPKKYRTINALIISGPGNYLRYFNKYRGAKIYTKQTLEKSESMFMVLSLLKNQLFRFYKEHDFSPEFKQQFEKEKKIKADQIIFEEARSRLKGSLGANKYHDVLNLGASTVGLRSSFGEAFVASFPVLYRGLVRYFVSCVWDEFSFCPTFLRRAFALRRKNEIAELEQKSKNLLRRFDPGSIILPKPMVLMAYDGIRFDSFSSEEREPHILSNLVKNTFRSKLLLRQETEGEEASIFQVYPCRNIAVYMLGAQQDITHLRKIEKLRSVMFFAGVILFMLFALSAARNLSASFTGPLQHLLWGLRQVEGNDYSVRLKDSREDEFGSISRAFNLMTRRLREKDALGKFVSNSVKKIAASSELLKKALAGSEEEVTVVFASLEGFAGIANVADEAEIERYLEFSLSNFFNRASQYGGEIDKVIGEKILIIFPHKDHGREGAVAAALALARDIRKDFSEQSLLKPVFGINMGKVISGIIGTAAVRMDYTVIGDPVNVAARLCSLAHHEMPVIVSGPVKETAKSAIKVQKINIDRVKGKKQEVEVFGLVE